MSKSYSARASISRDNGLAFDCTILGIKGLAIILVFWVFLYMLLLPIADIVLRLG